jgi:hypothetical protein
MAWVYLAELFVMGQRAVELTLRVLCDEPLIQSRLSRETLGSLLDLVQYTGLAAVFVEKVTSQVSMEGDKE